MDVFKANNTGHMPPDSLFVDARSVRWRVNESGLLATPPGVPT